MELKRVISYADGRVVYYYDTQEVIWMKGKEPEVKIKNYNKKEVYGILGDSSTLYNSSRRLSRH